MKHLHGLYILAIIALFPIQGTAQTLKSEQRIERVRNEHPIGEMTPLFERRNFIPKDINRKILTYFLFRPVEPYPLDLKFPLIVVLHGAPGRADAASSLITEDMKTAFPAFILVPVLSKTSIWVDTQQSGKSYEALYDLYGLIRDLSSTMQIDSGRVYVIGCSDGGTAVFGGAYLFPDLFAAGIAISGTWQPQFAPKMTRMPLWAINGAADDVIPPGGSRDTIAAIRQLGGKAHYTEVPDMGHNCASPSLYTPEIWSWLFRQSKP